jgi:hypothetical protein
MVAAARAPTVPKIRAVVAAALTMGMVSAKLIASSAENTADIAIKANTPRWLMTTAIDTANTMTAPTPHATRSQRGTRSAADTPTGAKASMGATLYTCRAAIAEATTLVSAVVTMAAGIA